MQDERWLTVSQVAERLQVTDETVRLYLRDRRMLGTLISRRAGWRVAESELARFLSEGPRRVEEGNAVPVAA